MEYVNFLISEKENTMDKEKNQNYGIPRTTFQNLSDEIILKILTRQFQTGRVDLTE